MIDCRMQAPVTLVREFYENYTRVYESLVKKYRKVNINSWTNYVREADGVTGECAAEEREQNRSAWQWSAGAQIRCII